MNIDFLIPPHSKDDIKAVRVYLGLTQPQLADRCECNTSTINTIETGKHQATKELLDKITEAFAEEGIRFNPNGGFRIENNILKIFEGKTCFEDILQNIFITCNENKEEVLFLGSDDRRSTKEVIKAQAKLYKANIPCKYLIANKNNYIISPLEESRKINEDFFLANDAVVLYKDKVGFVSQANFQNNKYIGVVKIFIIKDAGMYKQFKKYFYRLWNKGKKPTYSSTKQLLFRPKK